MIKIPNDSFQEQFRRFQRRIAFHSKEEFEAFDKGLPAKMEFYKLPLRNIARHILGFNQWKSEDIGTGRILNDVIRAIEIEKGPDTDRNNLVSWRKDHRPESHSHSRLRAALDETSLRSTIEQWFLDFFHDRVDDGALFREFLKFAGKRYDLVAYVFFLKDCDKYMPIAPTFFDSAFECLGIELKTAHRCSWENYVQYNNALRAIQQALIDEASVVNAKLIDAHSFCWLLVRKELDDPNATSFFIPLPQMLSNVTSLEKNQKSDPVSVELKTVTEEGFIEWDARRRQLGKQAEAIALASERRRLHTLGYPDLASAVESVSDKPALGYDIKSFNEDGTIRHIEVKSTRKLGNTMSFYVTPNEWKVSQTLPQYYFYLVLDVDKSSPSVHILRGSELSDQFLIPANYIASFGLSSS